MTPENRIKYAICNWLRTQNCFFWSQDNLGVYDPIKKCFRKSHNPFRLRGVADILGVWNGTFFAIEVKTKTGRVSDYQKSFIEQVNKHNGHAIVARSLEDVIAVFSGGC